MSLGANVTNFSLRYDRVATTSPNDQTILDLASTKADLIIVQPGQNNPGTSDDVLLTKDQVAAIRAGSDVEMVAAYMSIGKKESGRDFSAGLENDQFTGGDGVKYLDISSQQVIDALSANAAKLATQGFDAIFLDDVLAYFKAIDPVFQGDVRAAARALMKLVIAVDDAADAAAGDNVKIIVNGDPFLIGNLRFGVGNAAPDDGDTIASFLDATDAIFLESAYGNVSGVTPKADQLAAVNQTFRDPSNGDPTTVLALSYYDGLDGDTIEEKAFGFYADAARDGVIPFAAPGTLDATDRPFDRATPGRDVLSAAHGSRDRSGGEGNDLLLGDGRSNHLKGDAGDDLLVGGRGADTLTGGTGNDTYVVDDQGDKVQELKGQGTDLVQSSVSFALTGQYVENLTLTGTGSLSATGNSLANTLTGNAGANSLSGESGNDTLKGGWGKDTLTGGAGKDTFVFDQRFLKSFQADVVTDFVSADDTMALSANVFAGLSKGALAQNAFKLVTSLTKGADGDDRILYDKAHGDLYFDRDGSGSKYRPIKFAELKDGTDLSHTDFLVV